VPAFSVLLNQNFQYFFTFTGGAFRKITKHMICGGDDNTGVSACQGDSGGPYVCRNTQGYWEVHGVISWGSPICSLKQRYTVFAQVSKFRKWIDKYLNTTPNTI
jgi:secreted trypsin-like serine protease